MNFSFEIACELKYSNLNMINTYCKLSFKNFLILSQPQQLFFFFFSFSVWGETESTWYVGHCWPIVPAPND
jgi:hypothetical protein